VGFAISQLMRKKQTNIGKSTQAQITAKENRKQKIIQHIKENEKITNNEVEKLVGVSDTTATDYLQELEDEGLILQVGKEGRSVYYQLK